MPNSSIIKRYRVYIFLTILPWRGHQFQNTMFHKFKQNAHNSIRSFIPWSQRIVLTIMEFWHPTNQLQDCCPKGKDTSRWCHQLGVTCQTMPLIFVVNTLVSYFNWRVDKNDFNSSTWWTRLTQTDIIIQINLLISIISFNSKQFWNLIVWLFQLNSLRTIA
jgi:hypothetical protein